MSFPSTSGLHLARGLARINDHQNSIDIWTTSLIQVFQLLGVTILGSFVARRVRLSDFTSVRHIREINLPRLYLALLFFTAWFYFFTSGVVLRGIGPSDSLGLCEGGLYTSTGLYSLSKVFIYLFLAERAYVVWCPTMLVPRYKSKVYLVCATAIIVYFGVVCHLLIEGVARLRSDGMCMVGFDIDAIILLLVYDVCINILLTGIFVWPLVRTRFCIPQLRRIAWRSVIGASIVLGVTCVNIIVLGAMHGRERGYVCLITWEADVLLGSIALFRLTSGKGLRPIASTLQTRSHANRDCANSGSNSKRTNMPLPDLPFLAHPDSVRLSSLPSIMTHGMLSSVAGSETSLSSVVLAEPGAAVVREECVWSPPVTPSVQKVSDVDLEFNERPRSHWEDEKCDCSTQGGCDPYARAETWL